MVTGKKARRREEAMRFPAGNLVKSKKTERETQTIHMSEFCTKGGRRTRRKRELLVTGCLYTRPPFLKKKNRKKVKKSRILKGGKKTTTYSRLQRSSTKGIIPTYLRTEKKRRSENPIISSSSSASAIVPMAATLKVYCERGGVEEIETLGNSIEVQVGKGKSPRRRCRRGGGNVLSGLVWGSGKKTKKKNGSASLKKLGKNSFCSDGIT